MQLVTNTQVPVQMQDKTLLSYLPRRQSLDLSFRDIYYKVLALSLNKKPEMKQILHGVSGDFQAGQLTAILGPSGAGKSTLLNILAGYTERGVTGTVRVNGVNREARRFCRQACYIMQENELRPLLTTRESMSYAARLKLGGGKQAPSSKALDLQVNQSVGSDNMELQITEILETLRLIECSNTRAGLLSGGQRRRLSIALELLNNPPIMFLDEPTTGLDSASCAQCIELLRFLARGGRTVVITIHQPSARMFERFDQLYTVADGRCIYRGAPQGLVPFLAARNLTCPPYHNPADFLLEVACGEHGEHGLADFVSRQVSPVHSPVRAASLENHDSIRVRGEIPSFEVESVYVDDDQIGGSQAPLFVQFLLLYVRNLHVLKRDYKQLTVRLACHISIALLFGYLYRGVGSDAEGALANWVYIYGTCLFLMYTGKMAVTLSFPLELNCLTREHFNRWYSLGPYLASILCVEIPFQIVSALCYLSISYWMTGQPMETSRAAPFFGLCVLTSLTAQGFGFLIGATLPVTIAVFIGPTIGVLLSIFGFCIIWRDTPYLFRWLFHISYFRAAFQAAVYAVYGNDRGTLECKELYCHFRYPHKFLAEMDIPPDVDMLANAGFVTAWGLIMHIATYIALWIRLNKR